MEQFLPKKAPPPPPKGAITTNGRIITSDASSYNVQNYESEITREEFIPYEFAKSKFEVVIADFKSSVETYKAYINELEIKQKDQLEKCKYHYETYILEVKGKAKRHIGKFINIYIPQLIEIIIFSSIYIVYGQKLLKKASLILRLN
jgi:hypothetical protein